MVDYKSIITIEPGRRGGKPTIRGMRISVNDILGWLASGVSIPDILADFDELSAEDIYAALSMLLTGKRFVRQAQNKAFVMPQASVIPV